MFARLKVTVVGGLCLVLFGCAEVPIEGPRNLAIVTASTGAHLSWSESSPATELCVERKLEGGRFQPIASLPGHAVEYVDTSVPPAACAYRVVAFSDGAIWSGAYSKEVRLPAR